MIIIVITNTTAMIMSYKDNPILIPSPTPGMPRVPGGGPMHGRGARDVAPPLGAAAADPGALAAYAAWGAGLFGATRGAGGSRML